MSEAYPGGCIGVAIRFESGQASRSRRSRLARPRGRADVCHHGAVDGLIQRPARYALHGHAGCIAVERDGADVRIDERLPCRAVAEIDLPPMEQGPPVNPQTFGPIALSGLASSLARLSRRDYGDYGATPVNSLRRPGRRDSEVRSVSKFAGDEYARTYFPRRLSPLRRGWVAGWRARLLTYVVAVLHADRVDHGGDVLAPAFADGDDIDL